MGFGFAPFGFYNKKKNSGPSYETIQPPPYTGANPYSGEDIGLGAPQLKSLSEQYLRQIMDRSEGKGAVGFDPTYKSLLKQNYLSDLEDKQNIEKRETQAQASSQGLRGGIPLSIGEQANKRFLKERQSGLNQIDIADLEGQREDRNTATYAQPEFVGQGVGVQQNKANFDLAKYQATLPTYLMDEPQQPSQVLPALIGAAGTIGGAYVGGPAGAAAGNQAASTLAQSYANQQKKKLSPYLDYYNPQAPIRRGMSPVY